MYFTEEQIERLKFLADFAKLSDENTVANRTVTDDVVIGASRKLGIINSFVFLFGNSVLKVGHGRYVVPVINSDGIAILPHDLKKSEAGANKKARKASASNGTAQPKTKEDNVTDQSDVAVSVIDQSASFIPEKLSAFVPFGSYDRILKIIESRRFLPVYITGLSGNGKTLMVAQACASATRELIRVNVTAETDEADLIGGWTLVNGETKFQYGPVIEAMLRGAVLLLDEYDLGGVKTLCLQPVMEGSPIFIKKINRWIHPAPGFTVVATANTKGRGENDRMVGTNIINEAALDRFKATIFHDYPEEAIEAKILRGHAKIFGLSTDDSIISLLVRWGASNRKTFAENGTDEVLTTRRLVAALEFYSIFEDEITAVQLVTERFEKTDRDSLVKLFKAMFDDEVKKKAVLKSAEAIAKKGKSALAAAIDPNDPF